MAARYKLVYLPSAKADILDIVQFHTNKVGSNSAREIYRVIRATINNLRDFPMMGQIHPDSELAVQGYRKLVLTKTYVSVYKIIDNTVTVYRVVNGAIDYPKLLK